MIIKPKIRGFICTTTHPGGCDANVREQIAYTQAQGRIENGPKRVLVIGSSSGYGLASRIAAAFGSGAATIGVFVITSYSIHYTKLYDVEALLCGDERSVRHVEAWLSRGSELASVIAVEAQLREFEQWEAFVIREDAD